MKFQVTTGSNRMIVTLSEFKGTLRTLRSSGWKVTAQRGGVVGSNYFAVTPEGKSMNLFVKVVA